MRARLAWICAIVVGMLAAPAALYARPYPLGTAFAYQGQLNEGGNPYSGNAQMIFHLYDDPAAGTLLGSVGPVNVPVTDGLFTVTVDFGEGVFTGQARWLEIVVNGTTLSPRQELTPAPHALALPGLWTQQNGISPNLIGGYSANIVDPDAVGATIGGGGYSGLPNYVYDSYGTVAGGIGNIAGSDDGDDTSAPYVTVGGGYQNTASDNHTTVGGGYSNMASGFAATVGGGYDNTADGTYYATVGGGQNNTASGSRGTVGGGRSNTASGDDATVAGGAANQASNSYAMVGGGWANTASGTYTVVGGGNENTASGVTATVGGGYSNLASGAHATIVGGYDNEAAGASSFAAGRRAQALHDGAFVWGDSTDEDFASTTNDQFLIRASGGVGIGTNDPQTDVEIEGDTGLRVTTGEHWNVFGEFRHAFSGGLQINANAGGGYADIRLQTDGTTRLFVESQGNVGIGTDAPEQTLHVVSAGQSAILGQNTGTSGERFGLRGETDSTEGRAVFGWATAATGTTYGVIGRSDSETGRGVFGNANAASGTNFGVFGATNSPDGFAGYFVGGRNYFSGNVGIGTAAPQTELDVAGDVHASGTISKAYTDGTRDRAIPIAYGYIRSSGTIASGTPNFSCTYNASLERYEVTIADESYYYLDYVTLVTPSGSSPTFASTNSVGGDLLVFIKDISGNAVQRDFQFVTYKAGDPGLSPLDSRRDHPIPANPHATDADVLEQTGE